MLGKPSDVKPVNMNNSPGPCVAVLLVIEWMKHISSTNSPSRGSKLETILPHLPLALKAYGLCVNAPCSP